LAPFSELESLNLSWNFNKMSLNVTLKGCLPFTVKKIKKNIL